MCDANFDKKSDMHIVLCLDYSPFTKNVLNTMQMLVESLKEAKVTVIHIIDETLFSAGTGEEQQLNEDLKRDSDDLKQLASKYLGDKINYVEAYGIPRQKIDEILSGISYDILAVGSHSRSFTGARMLGSLAEHLLRNSTKPVFVIP